jgi:anti-sigma B factor antagonist
MGPDQATVVAFSAHRPWTELRGRRFYPCCNFFACLVYGGARRNLPWLKAQPAPVFPFTEVAMSLDEIALSIDPGQFELDGKDPWLPALLDVSVSWMEDTAIMVLTGEVDLSTASLLQDHLDEILMCGRADLVVDLGLVTFLGSTGMSFLVMAQRRLQAQGSRLVVFAPPYRIRGLFDICELNSVLVVMPDNSDEGNPSRRP